MDNNRKIALPTLWYGRENFTLFRKVPATTLVDSVAHIVSPTHKMRVAFSRGNKVAFIGGGAYEVWDEDDTHMLVGEAVDR